MTWRAVSQYHSTPRGSRRCRSAQPRAVGAGNGSSKGTQTKRLVMLAKWSFPLTSIAVYQGQTVPVLFPSARSWETQDGSLLLVLPSKVVKAPQVVARQGRVTLNISPCRAALPLLVHAHASRASKALLGKTCCVSMASGHGVASDPNPNHRGRGPDFVILCERFLRDGLNFDCIPHV